MMKKSLMTLATLLCCVMAMTMFTSCEKEKDKFDYAIIVEPRGPFTGDAAAIWCNNVLHVYMSALGVDSDRFNKHGSQEECDKEVQDACKKAESSLPSGGQGEVIVQNTTVNKTVYRREIH